MDRVRCRRDDGLLEAVGCSQFLLGLNEFVDIGDHARRADDRTRLVTLGAASGREPDDLAVVRTHAAIAQVDRGAVVDEVTHRERGLFAVFLDDGVDQRATAESNGFARHAADLEQLVGDDQLTGAVIELPRAGATDSLRPRERVAVLLDSYGTRRCVAGRRRADATPGSATT